jgi:opacity protein-like surface antigen
MNRTFALIAASALALMPVSLSAQTGARSPAEEAPAAGPAADSTAGSAARAFLRSDRPHGFKIGYAGPGRHGNLGVQVDAIILNRIGLEFSATVLTTTLRARYYLLRGLATPFVGIGSGMSFMEGGIWVGSWKEAHLGFERAFDNGLVLEVQVLGFFDRRGDIYQSYAFAPGIGFRF